MVVTELRTVVQSGMLRKQQEDVYDLLIEKHLDEWYVFVIRNKKLFLSTTTSTECPAMLKPDRKGKLRIVNTAF